MPLTDVVCKSAKPKPDGKPAKLSDGGGLFLLVNQTGKYWRLAYRFDGKQKTLALGVYPDVPLVKARDRRDSARRLLADGVDPGAKRKAEKVARADTFEAIAREWCEKQRESWVDSHAQRVVRRFERDLFPWLGSRPVGGITSTELLQVIRRIEARGVIETAHRAMAYCGQVFRYAIATGRAQRDITADLRGALKPALGSNFAAFTDPGPVAHLLRAIDGYKGSFVTLQM